MMPTTAPAVASSSLSPSSSSSFQPVVSAYGATVSTHRVLLALTEAGVPRQEAYRMVQRNAMKVWETGADFQAVLLADKEVTKALSPDAIKAQFDLGYHTKHVDTIFARVFGAS